MTRDLHNLEWLERADHHDKLEVELVCPPAPPEQDQDTSETIVVGTTVHPENLSKSCAKEMKKTTADVVVVAANVVPPDREPEDIQTVEVGEESKWTVVVDHNDLLLLPEEKCQPSQEQEDTAGGQGARLEVVAPAAQLGGVGQQPGPSLQDPPAVGLTTASSLQPTAACSSPQPTQQHQFVVQQQMQQPVVKAKQGRLPGTRSLSVDQKRSQSLGLRTWLLSGFGHGAAAAARGRPSGFGRGATAEGRPPPTSTQSKEF